MLALWVRVIVAIVLLHLPTTAFSQAEKRIALLIGNKDYKAGVGSLSNPLNDIRIVGAALKSVGFEVLKTTQNATRVAMLRAVHEFAGKLRSVGPDAVGFLYYSGHGIASAGENYLIPVDVDEPSTLELSLQGVKHSEVLAILRSEAPNAATIWCLMRVAAPYRACLAARLTANPASERRAAGIRRRARQDGQRPRTGQRTVCSGIGGGRAGESRSDRPHHVPQRARRRDTKTWWRSSALDGGRYSASTTPYVRRREQGGGAPLSQPAPMTTTRLSEVAEAWDRAKDTKSIAALEAFIARYKDTFYGDLARARINELEQSSAVNPPKQAAPPNATPRAADEGKRACRHAICRSELALPGNAVCSSSSR